MVACTIPVDVSSVLVWRVPLMEFDVVEVEVSKDYL